MINLKYRSDFDPNDNESEYILSSHNNINKGDSGHYLELCYGKYKNELIIDILKTWKIKEN